MGYDDLRKGRFSEANRVYFITTVTHQRIKLFSDFGCARIVIQTMKQLDNDGDVTSLSWVVMPDHVHWLIQLSDDCGLSNLMKRMKAISAHDLNKRLNRQGQVWQNYFYDHCLRSDEDIKQISRYIIANPLRAKIVGNIGDYPHWDAIWL